MDNKTTLELANEYLEICHKQYGARITYNVRDFVRGFAKFLDKRNIPKQKLVNTYSQVAFITEDHNHLTGGRYYNYFLACALVEAGFDVTIYTNTEATFLNHFSKYRLPRIEVIPGNPKDLERIDVQAEIYIGTPASGDMAAIRNAKRYNKRVYTMIFDPFPMMKKYLGKEKFMGYDKFIAKMLETKVPVITLCKATHPYIYDWINKKESDLIPIYPCINSRVKNTIPPQERKDFVLFISRLASNKRFPHVLQACKENNVPLKVITSASMTDYLKKVREYGLPEKTEFIFNASEEEKFTLIKQARAVINGAIFEGFGMWAAEAIDCGTPLVCYDYPTFREIQEFTGATNVYFAKHNDPRSLSEQLSIALKEAKYLPENNFFSFDSMVSRVSEVFGGEYQPNS